MNKKYQLYKINNLCRRCGEKPLPGKTRCSNCHNDHLKYQRDAKERAISKGLCRYCCQFPKLENKSMCSECLKKHTHKEKIRNLKCRKECIEHYGGSCVCCGNTNYKYLELDHVNNDGASHRRELGKGKSLYKWAKKNNFPNRLQLLCGNCHRAKTYFGGCTKTDHDSMREHIC